MSPPCKRTRSEDIISEKIIRLVAAEHEFHVLTRQVYLLNDKLYAISKRLEKARVNNQRMFRYGHRLRSLTVEGVRDIYYKIAKHKASEIQSLQMQLYGQQAHFDSDMDDNSRPIDSV